jgi:hypothetical protein
LPAITSARVPPFSEDSLVRSFSYLRDFISGYRLRRLPLPSFVMSLNISAVVPLSAGFSLRRFFPRHGWLVIGDGRLFYSLLDEEDVGVERSRCGD